MGACAKENSNPVVSDPDPDKDASPASPKSYAEACALRAREHFEQLASSLSAPPPMPTLLDFVSSPPAFIKDPLTCQDIGNNSASVIPVRRLLLSCLISGKDSQWLRTLLTHQNAPAENIDVRKISGANLLKITRKNLTEQEIARLFFLVASVSAGLDTIGSPYPVPVELLAKKAKAEKTAAEPPSSGWSVSGLWNTAKSALVSIGQIIHAPSPQKSPQMLTPSPLL